MSSILTPETERLSVAELHDVTEENFLTIYVEISRRVEPGAGNFSGTRFVTPHESIGTFESVSNALSFIDTVQSTGLPEAIKQELNGTVSDEDVLDALHFTPDRMEPDRYFELTGMTDPFNLSITPIREYAVETQIQSAESQSHREQETTGDQSPPA